MADSIGPNQYQAGISGSGAPQVNRYDTQVDMQGTPQPANAHGQHVISGFGEAAPDLAKALGAAGEVARQFWLEQQKSAAELNAKRTLKQAAAGAQPGQRISQTVNKSIRQFSDSLVRAANTPEMKQTLSEQLAHINGQIAVQGTLFDDQQTLDDAAHYFDRTLSNKEQTYATIPYDQIDQQLFSDLGGINSSLRKLPLSQEARSQMQETLMQRLSEAANRSKIRLDPERYLAQDVVDNAHVPVDASAGNPDDEVPAPWDGYGPLSYSMGTANQKRIWRQDAVIAREARLAEAEQARQQRAATLEKAHRDAVSALIDKYSNGVLTSGDVLDSGLSPDTQQQCIAMMARGPFVAGNPALHRQLVLQALNGNFKDKSDLLHFQARKDGINSAQAQNIASAMQLAREPYMRRFVRSAEHPILGNPGITADPDGDRQFSNMLIDLAAQVSDAQKKGLSPRDILDDKSKYYIGDRLIAAYARSPSERRDAKFNQGLNIAAAAGLPVPQPDEVPDEFLRRWKGDR